MTMTVLDRALMAGDAGRVTGEQERPDPEVPEKARRRTFTAQYKLDVVAEYDAAPSGEKGAVLRREGLYSSHVIEWRRARDAGTLAGPARPRGRPAADPRDAQIARLQKEKAQLEQELARARFVVDVQAKLQALLDAGRRSPRARTPGLGRSRDRRGDRPARAGDRHPGGLRGLRRAAGHLVPAAPDQPARAEGSPGPACRADPAAGARIGLLPAHGARCTWPWRRRNAFDRRNGAGTSPAAT
jgi:transposase